MKKQRLVSGITATGNLTIGNYLGAIKQFIEYQKKYEVIVFAADLHTLTSNISSKEIKENTKRIIATYLAAGLDSKKSIIFVQSEILQHTLLSWILLTSATMGELSRMTQFKSKSQIIQKRENATNSIPVGLFAYPTLMASDILLYQPDIVPVGKDQKQHLELTQVLAKRFNNKFSKTFNIPKISISSDCAKIMSLIDPTKKMSKSSDNPKSYISLLDNPKVAIKKIKSAITDSEGKIYASKNKPGITNLLNIYAGFKNISLKETEKIFNNKNYLQLKEEVGNVVASFLSNFQEKYYKELKNVNKTIKEGKIKAEKIAKKTMDIVCKKIGIK